MKVIALTYVLFVIASGVFIFAFVLLNSIINRNIHHISYSPKSENETEFGLRSLLFLYPNAVIDTPKTPVSEKIHKENKRVTVHQEI